MQMKMKLSIEENEQMKDFLALMKGQEQVTSYYSGKNWVIGWVPIAHKGKEKTSIMPTIVGTNTGLGTGDNDPFSLFVQDCKFLSYKTRFISITGLELDVAIKLAANCRLALSTKRGQRVMASIPSRCKEYLEVIGEEASFGIDRKAKIFLTALILSGLYSETEMRKRGYMDTYHNWKPS